MPNHETSDSNESASFAGTNLSRSTSKKSKKMKYSCKFKKEWASIYNSLIQKSRHGDNYAFCSSCRLDISIAHGGQGDIDKHFKTERHKQFTELTNNNKKLTDYINTTNNSATIRAECLFTAFLVEHNIPIAASDHTGKLFRAMFPDSAIAKTFRCGRTKSTQIIKNAFLPHALQKIIHCMQTQLFTLAVDASSDELTKELVLLVRYFDDSVGHVQMSFYDLPVCLIGTAESTFNVIEQSLNAHNIPFTNIIGFSSDNASVMLGKVNSVFSRMQSKNELIYNLGCPCHMAHIVAHDATKKLSINVEDLIISIYYYFDKSCKRKVELKEFEDFCGVESRKILKHVSTRWLSLGKTLNRLLQQYPAIKSYFNSQNQTNQKIVYITRMLSNPMTEVYCLFLQSVIPLFDTFNTVMQTESPMIHTLHISIIELLKDILSRFIKVAIIKSISDITTIEYDNASNQKEDKELFIGFTTRQLLLSDNLLLETRYDSNVKKFYTEVRQFYSQAVKSILKKLPIHDTVLQNMIVLDYTKRESISFDHLVSLTRRFKLCDNNTMNKLESEFLKYQLLDFSKEEKQKLPVDVFWHGVSKRVASVNNLPEFPHLSKVMKDLLVLPHSNADCERMFSHVRKNRTEFRSELGNDTMKGILSTKFNLLSDCACYDFKPDANLLSKAQKATYTGL